jgi:OFA family oxalate/formate antiporter-like MFS transporter
MLVINGVAILLYNTIGSFHLYYWIGICIVGLCFGGYLAIFPAITADYYGTKNIGINYGLVFTAYGVGGLLGSLFAPRVLEITKSYSMAFTSAGILCLLGAVVALISKSPSVKEA